MLYSLTQFQLAHATEISRDTIQRIERGTIDARISHLWRIARALEMPLADLVSE
jgi:predicted transcriptional regulator